jgi:hypothetical protein
MSTPNAILAFSEAAAMTGWQLAQALGLETTDGRKVLRLVNRHGLEIDFDAWLTTGRGRQSGRWYFHMGRWAECRVVDPDGNDTGARVRDYRHWRGRTSERSDTYQEVR